MGLCSSRWLNPVWLREGGQGMGYSRLSVAEDEGEQCQIAWRGLGQLGEILYWCRSRNNP
jgi:hypothetical protein